MQRAELKQWVLEEQTGLQEHWKASEPHRLFFKGITKQDATEHSLRP